MTDECTYLTRPWLEELHPHQVFHLSTSVIVGVTVAGSTHAGTKD